MASTMSHLLAGLLACAVLGGCPAPAEDPPVVAQGAAADSDSRTARALESIEERLDDLDTRLAAVEQSRQSASASAQDDEEDPLARQAMPLTPILQGPPALPDGESAPAQAQEDGPMPIAGWNWVPWQEVKPGDHLGVVAFHIDGIARVEFRYGEDCPAAIVSAPSLNEATGTVEYHAPVPEGAEQVEAIVYPTRGPPRALESRPLNPPRDDVLILHGQRIEGPIDPAGKKHLWLQDCELVGGGHWNAVTFQSIYAINCRASGLNRFFQKVELARNCTVNNFESDAFRDCRMIINCTASNQGRESEVHSDVVQFYQAAENAIIYGLTAVENIREQGIFSRGKGVEHKGVAIVNCKVNLSGFPAQNQWSTRTHHFVVEGNEFLGSPFTINLEDSVATGFRGSTDVVFRDNTFQWVKILPDDSTVRNAFRENRFINRWPAYVADRAGKEVGELIGEGATLLRNLQN